MVLYSYESVRLAAHHFLFAMASVHALHQLGVGVRGLQQALRGIRCRCFSRAVDYGVVFSSLYPIVGVEDGGTKTFISGPCR